MTQRHTAGPWKSEGRSIINPALSGVGRTIATQIDSEANARLIAAAPELLEALKAVMSEWRDGYGLNCVEQLRAAIAKAEGRS